MKVEQMIKDRIAEEVEVQQVSVKKNNGLILNGVTVKKPNVSVAPTIYRQEDESDEEFADRCAKIWNSGELNPEIMKLDVNNILMNVKYIYDHCIPVLINKEKNRDRLDDIYYDSFLDLAIIYKVIVSSGASGIGTVTLKNDHVNRLIELGLDIDMLKACAMEHMHTQTFIDSMANVLSVMMGGEDMDIDDFIDVDPSMLVLSTQNKMDGAAVILDNVTMKTVHKMLNTDEVFIIPSSIHEVIAIPATDDTDEVLQMIRSANMTEVNADEILSDNLYISTLNNDDIEWRYVA